MKEKVSDGAHEVRRGVDSRGKVQRTEKKRLVILRDDLVRGRARVIIDEEHVL